jgi:GT2 family glycosyltransferase
MTNISNKISVVIATIGNDYLLKTLVILNSSSLIPDEIIIVIPLEYKQDINLGDYSNLRIVYVPFKGQVAQRAYGFTLTKNNFVLQLDDDIDLDKYCVENLVKALINLGDGNSVGPVILYKDSRNSVYDSGKNISKFILNMKAYFLSGAPWGRNKMGKISKCGSAFGFDNTLITNKYNQSEWLAGGCILHLKTGLIYDNYFPFNGKAYGEDLIHSFYLKKLGIKMFVVNNAICFIDRPIIDNQSYSLELDLRSRLHLNKLRELSLFHIYIWYYSRRIFNKLF